MCVDETARGRRRRRCGNGGHVPALLRLSGDEAGARQVPGAFSSFSFGGWRRRRGMFVELSRVNDGTFFLCILLRSTPLTRLAPAWTRPSADESVWLFVSSCACVRRDRVALCRWRRESRGAPFSSKPTRPACGHTASTRKGNVAFYKRMEYMEELEENGKKEWEGEETRGAMWWNGRRSR
jgi:hypothetical protein